MMKPHTPVHRRLPWALALVLSLVAAPAVAGDGRHGGRVQAYDRATGTLVVEGRQAHVGPATKLLGYGGERISATDLEPGVSVSYEIRPTGPGSVPEIRVLQLQVD
ncbi:MAG: hypothetical protein AB7I68_05340 [Porticoccaceae bacterium]